MCHGFKDYLLCNLDLLTTPLDPEFGVVSYFISSHDGTTDAGNSISTSNKPLSATLLRQKELKSGSFNITLSIFLWCLQVVTRV